MFGGNAASVAAGFPGQEHLVFGPSGSSQPPSAGANMQGTMQPSSGEEVRTLFITGFPQNVHERELHNLVCWLPGYEASQMNTKPATGTSPQGFALFVSGAAAQAAMLLLHDHQFDTDCHLRCEMAHKNMYLKDDPSVRRADTRRTAAAAAALAGHPGLSPGLAGMQPSMAGAGAMLSPIGPFTAAAMAPHAFSGPLLASTLAALRPAAHHAVLQHHHHAAGGGGGGLLPPPGGAAALAAQQAGLVGMSAVGVHPVPGPVAGFGPVTNKFDNPPCNTLFIGNLGDTVDEGELTALFAAQPGYRQLKLLRHPRQVSCFVEFMDVPHASAVHAGLQGALLTSSDRGPIRIQYSKNPYGKRSPHHAAGGGSGTSVSGGSTSSAAAALFGGPGGAGLVHHPGAATAAGLAAGMLAAEGGEFGGWTQPFTLG